MKQSQKQVEEFMRLAEQEVVNTPAIPSMEVRKLRSKLILEEAFETIGALGISPDLEEIADGLADLLYVVLGTAVACGIDIEPIFQEVHRSNMSKFIDGHRREDGKWIKGPSYSPADVATIIERQKSK